MKKKKETMKNAHKDLLTVEYESLQKQYQQLKNENKKLYKNAIGDVKMKA